LIKLFQKFAVSKGGALVASAEAKLFYRHFLFVSFFFWAFCIKRKSGKRFGLTRFRTA
jgi:hypothetical protein